MTATLLTAGAAGRDRTPIAALAQVTVIAAGPAGDDAHLPARRAPPALTRSARRAQRPSRCVASRHWFDLLATDARLCQLAAPTTRTGPAFGGGRQWPVGAAAAHTGGLGQRRASGPQGNDESADHPRGGADEQRRHPVLERVQHVADDGAVGADLGDGGLDGDRVQIGVGLGDPLRDEGGAAPTTSCPPTDPVVAGGTALGVHALSGATRARRGCTPRCRTTPPAS